MSEKGGRGEVRLCTLRELPPHLRDQAHNLAVQINPVNAVATGVMRISKLWQPGTAVTVAFLDGSNPQRDRVPPYFHEWEKYANIKFIFILNRWNANVRVSFRGGEGSWSLLGVDALAEPLDNPTMVLGWIDEGTEEEEVRRVVLHEVGHVLGFEHELASPAKGGVDWDEERVFEFYSGQPYGWSREETRAQVLAKLPPDGLKYTDFDPHSIMCYWVPGTLTRDGRGTPMNWTLDDKDKELAGKAYPKHE